jgi:hypothetical protein
MTKFRETGARAPRARRPAAWLVFFVCAACAAAATIPAGAQSGRRSPTMSKTSPAPPTAEKAVEATTTATKKDVKPLASFVIVEDTGSAFEVDYTARRIVLGGFVARLDQSSVVAVTRGGRATRKEARDRAKTEREAFVVLVELEEELDSINMRGRSRPEDRLLVIKSYVYTPATGDLKFTDRFVARPYDSRASVGGVRVPVPSGGGYGLEAQFERAGRDAAERLLSRFQITLPPEK